MLITYTQGTEPSLPCLKSSFLHLCVLTNTHSCALTFKTKLYRWCLFWNLPFLTSHLYLSISQNVHLI